ncbi:MAG: UMP kinase [Candidatus Methanomethylicia archaeon]|nr:UMP kinase [Candidatus Methanomethylicia archaeon]MDW7988871.1 UMP kinase [Nitrososphaerota archaeon]
MKKVVVRLGGHLIADSSKINVERISEFAKVFKEIYNKGYLLRVVVGGGYYAREYINTANYLSSSEFEKDYLAIMITRANAFLVMLALKEYAYNRIPQTLDEFLSINNLTNKIIVCGGLTPAQSTMTVAAIIAEAIGADLIVNMTDVDGVYTHDPKKHPDAELLKKITTCKLKNLLKNQLVRAGFYELIDQHAINIIERSKIPLRIINGKCVENLLKVINGEDIGTLVIVEELNKK